MTRHNATLLLCLAAALSLVAGGSAVVGAAGPSTGSSAPIAVAAPVGSTLTYQGRLADATGTPLSGSYDLTFQLWDDPAAGTQVGPDMLRTGVVATAGLFTVDLDVPDGAFDGTALWLRIAVNGEWLAPRQALSSAPYALTLRPGAVVSGHSAEPVRTLTVLNQGLAPALRAEGATVGLHAVGLTAVKAEGPLGVLGTGLGSLAVGVRGIATDGTGVEGRAATGTGVVGLAEGDGATGVSGTVAGYGSVGVRGESTFGTGIEAAGETGLKAKGTVNFAVIAEGPMGIEAKGALADGLSAETAGEDPAAAVRGSASTDAFGGHFTSAGGIALWGLGLEGVHGESTSAEHTGVHGVSPGTGVLGESATNIGVKGQSTSGFGVIGTSSEAVGVSGNGGEVPLFVLDGKYGVVGNGEDFGVAAYGGKVGGQFAGPIGVWGETSGDYGLYTAQKIFTGGGCVGCSTALLATNAGPWPLAVGDVVVVAGVASPLAGHETPRLSVRAANAADTLLRGVVQSRVAVDIVSLARDDGKEPALVAVPSTRPGAIKAGDDLVVVVAGLARVRVDATALAIGVGDELAAWGRDASIRAVAGDGSGSPPIGTALEPLESGSGLVWVLLAGS